MPFYAFHLNVPSPPDVVAGRIRAVVGNAPSFWENMTSSWTGRQPSDAFLGVVDGRSFRIHRNIQYRNSFLPMIRGKIVATPTGSRVNVFMYMHPLSLAFMLVWFGFLVSMEWRLLDCNIARSFFPLGMIIFGLALSLGGFFYEALKVMPLLSEAILDSSAPSIPAPARETTARSEATLPSAKSALGRGVISVSVLVVLAGFVLAGFYEYRLRASGACKAGVTLAFGSKEAEAALGEPMRVAPGVRGMVHETEESGYALLAIPLSGPMGKGVLRVVANRAPTGWDIERAVLQTSAGSARIDLTPPVQREAFHYPAPGSVYILPFDEAAASDVAELPRYYKARLDLDVTVLPTLRLAPDSRDPKTGQVIAERVLDFIVESHPDIAADLDSEILGVTSEDLNIRSSGWSYATNYRHGRFGVVSTARLHGMPWYAGNNPEVLPVRARKLITKNLALLHYPLELSSDVSSALASSTFTASDVDAMGESFGGESRTTESQAWEAPCVRVTQGLNGKQSWRVGCTDDPPRDSRFETFETYQDVPLLVMSRADFTFTEAPSFAFVRQYRPQDDRSRAFGVGATDSYDIFPVGDSQTFSSIELVLPSGAIIRYTRTSPGRGFADARMRAGKYMSSPFSLSSLMWNGHGWDISTQDGWTYKFPSCGPDSPWQQCALTGIHSASGKSFSIQRTRDGELRQVRAPGGETIDFTSDEMHRIISAKENSGRTIIYEYDAGGRLVHLRDSRNGDEFYEYDPLNQLTSVSDSQHHRLLTNVYGYLGEVRSQTLANGDKLLYESAVDESRKLESLKLTLPNGYVIEWMLTKDGLLRSWPYLPAHGG